MIAVDVEALVERDACGVGSASPVPDHDVRRCTRVPDSALSCRLTLRRGNPGPTRDRGAGFPLHSHLPPRRYCWHSGLIVGSTGCFNVAEILAVDELAQIERSVVVTVQRQAAF